jgi:hypothetical protein
VLERRSSGFKTMLVHVTLVAVGETLRLRRLTCGKALPFRRSPISNNLLPAGWEAEPPSQRGGRARVRNRPESRRLSAGRGGRAAAMADLRW